MPTTRREFLAATSVLPLAAAAQSQAATATAPPAAAPAAPVALPDRVEFQTGAIAYLDSGSQHPMARSAREAIGRYLAKRSLDPAASGYSLPDDGVREKYARLVNADVDEIAYAPSTTAAEQIFVRGLGLPAPRAHVVTDTLHFFGSIPLYLELARQGCKVTWVRDRHGRIAIEDIEVALRRGARLVSLSLVSTINGFEHDLKAVCDLAHSRGALVYADIIHAAGAVPIDLHASGVDFAACSAYKWLMGDFGLAFAYVAKGARAKLRRTEYGYYGVDSLETHIYPFDSPGKEVAEATFKPDAEGTLAHGTHAHTVIAQLDWSLDYIAQLGVERIQAHARRLTTHLREELPKLGYEISTPAESPAPIIACPYQDARAKLAQRLQAAHVKITLAQNRFRVTPSVFNGHDDIERLLAALGRSGSA